MTDAMYSLAPIYRSPPVKSAIVAVAFSPDGQRLAYGDRSGRIVVVYDLLGVQSQELDITVGNKVQIVALRWWTPSAALDTASSGVPIHLLAGDSAGYAHVVRLPPAHCRAKCLTVSASCPVFQQSRCLPQGFT